MIHFIILATALTVGVQAFAEEAKRHTIKGSTIEDAVFADPVNLGGAANSDGVAPVVITPGGSRSAAPAKAANLNPDNLTVDGKSPGTGPKEVKDWAAKDGGDGTKSYDKGLNINGKDTLANVVADSKGVVKSISGNGVNLKNPVNGQGKPATLDDVSRGNFAKGSGVAGPGAPVSGSC